VWRAPAEGGTALAGSRAPIRPRPDIAGAATPIVIEHDHGSLKPSHAVSLYVAARWFAPLVVLAYIAGHIDAGPPGQ